jgi:outer membrane protein TolC
VFLSFSEIPLHQAVIQGIQKNVEFKNHLLQNKNLLLTKQNTLAKNRFSINSSASYRFQSEQMDIMFPGTSMTVGTKHNFDFKVALYQPIYTGGVLQNMVRLDLIKSAIEKNQTFLSKIMAAAAVKGSYFNYRLMTSQLNSLNLLIKELKLHYKKQRDYYREELIKKSDLLETEAKLQEQILISEDLKLSIQKEKINFKSLCNYNLEEIEKNYSEAIHNLTDSLAYFKAFHPIVESLDEKIRMLALKEKTIKGEYHPQIGGFAEVHYGKPGIDMFANQWSFYFQGGINVSYKIFNWNKKKRDIQIVHYEMEKLKNNKADFIRNVEMTLEQLFSAVQSSQSKLATINQLIEIANEDVKLKKNLFLEQQISNIDFLSSLTKKQRYISKKHTILAQMELVRLRINQAIGRIEEVK